MSGAREHNLRNVSISLPRDKLVVFTGLSGSGKSSLAFDTIYAEGQRRYVESLSAYARQFLGQMDKPDVDFIEGLSPAISIDQKSASRNPRSTVGTVTEIYDYLRLLYARIGVPHDPETGERLGRQTPEQIVDRVLDFALGTRFQVLAPVVRGRKGTYGTLLADLAHQGYARAVVDGELIDLASVSAVSSLHGDDTDFAGSPDTDGGMGGVSGLELAHYETHDISVVVDRLVLREGIERRLTDSVETALRLAGGLVEIEIVEQRNSGGAGGDDGAAAATDAGGAGGDDGAAAATGAGSAGGSRKIIFSQYLSRPSDGKSFEELEPRSFSFNSPYGACSHCDGLGASVQATAELVVPNPDMTLREGAIVPWSETKNRHHYRVTMAVCEQYDIPPDVPWCELTRKHKDILLYAKGMQNNSKGTQAAKGRKGAQAAKGTHGVKGIKVPVSFVNQRGVTRLYEQIFEGVIPYLKRRHSESVGNTRERIEAYMRSVPCEHCGGARLKPMSLAVTVDGRNIDEVCRMPIVDAAHVFANLKLSNRDMLIADQVLREIRARLGFLNDVGLSYLTLARGAATLSGGEAQRIRLASQVGSGLVGVLYVLDEPSIGLHQRDNQRLIKTLTNMRDLGNTVLVVEHDEETIRAADHIVDIGPGAGVHGGEVVYSGAVEEIASVEKSVTGQYLVGRRGIKVPTERRTGNGLSLQIKGASENNLADIDVEIPLGKMVCVTGVSGSGKSSLIIEILLKALMQRIYRSKSAPGRHRKIEGAHHLDKVIAIDQSPIGRTPRSNAATYSGVFTHIRNLFARTTEARARGYQPGRFSFNVEGGRCEACKGDGTIRIEMHFLPDVYVPCEVCEGSRYNRDTLEVRFMGKNIADVLNMSCLEALNFFDKQPVIARHIQTLVDVGLGYVRLGQPATTLSGGEAQRVKLASELTKRPTGHTLYSLDEPTTGLHFEDVNNLLTVLGRLVDAGNTVVVIEHNLDVIKSADWIIDLGPEGGSGGGRVVGVGSPEDIAEMQGSYTGLYLREMLNV